MKIQKIFFEIFNEVLLEFNEILLEPKQDFIEDFIENLTPGVAIGLKLNIDDDRYTGWEVTTDQDNFDTRLIMGWKWGIIGVGAITDDNEDVYPHYTFGVSYEVLPGLSSNFEYVMTPDAPEGDTSLRDHLRLALSISF